MKEILQLGEIRVRLGKPSPDEARGFLSHTVPEIMDGAKVAMENSVAVHNRLDAFKTQMYEETGVASSQEDVCSQYISHFVLPGYGKAAVAALGDDASFRFYYDFTMGIVEVTSRLYEAEEARNGRTGELFRKSREKLEEIFDKTHLDTRKNSFVVIVSEAQTSRDLFEEDFNGFALVDRTIEELESDDTFLKGLGCSKEYVVAGAQLAAYLYKHSYAILTGQPYGDEL